MIVAFLREAAVEIIEVRYALKALGTVPPPLIAHNAAIGFANDRKLSVIIPVIRLLPTV